jgi:hypothetical protein
MNVSLTSLRTGPWKHHHLLIRSLQIDERLVTISLTLEGPDLSDFPTDNQVDYQSAEEEKLV